MGQTEKMKIFDPFSFTSTKFEIRSNKNNSSPIVFTYFGWSVIFGDFVFLERKPFRGQNLMGKVPGGNMVSNSLLGDTNPVNSMTFI